MNLLIITSREACSVALQSGGKTVAEKTWHHSPQSGRDLLGAIESLLQEQHGTVQDIDSVRIEQGDVWPSLNRIVSVTARSLVLGSGVKVTEGGSQKE